MLKRTVLPVRLAVAAIAVAALVAAPFSAQTARAAVNPPQALPADSTGTVAEGGNPTRTNDFSAQTFLPAGSVVVSVANTTRGITTSSVAGGGFGIELRPPAHQPLRVGTYDLRGNGNGIPGAASKPSLGGFDGHLDIIDLASNAQGLFTRFDIVLQGVGEIRMGEGDNTPLTFGARHILFDDAAVGVAPAYSRETLQNTGAAAVSLGSIGVTGRSASSFAVSSNTCSETLAAHAQCQFEIGFAPRSGGPQDAQVTVPVAGQTQTVEVAGNGLLGKTSLVTTGADTLDGGATHTYASGPLVPSVLRYLDGWSWQWANAYDVGANRATANFDAPAGARLAVGTHATGNFYPIAGPARYGTNVSLESEGCLYTHGSETVKSFALGGNGLPTSADITFTQYCEADTTPMTGTLLWQAR